MALQSSGQITMADIAGELGMAPTSPFSLRSASSLAGFSSPDAMSEFYGYSNVTYVPISYASGYVYQSGQSVYGSFSRLENGGIVETTSGNATQDLFMYAANMPSGNVVGSNITNGFRASATSLTYGQYFEVQVKVSRSGSYLFSNWSASGNYTVSDLGTSQYLLWYRVTGTYYGTFPYITVSFNYG